MQFREILQKCKGETVVINNRDERTLLEVDEDFMVIQGGNPQMRLTEFVPFSAITRVIRADYATGSSSLSIDIAVSGGDHNRAGAH